MYMQPFNQGYQQIPSYDYMEEPFGEAPFMQEGQFPYMEQYEQQYPQYQGMMPGYQGMPPFTPRRDPRYYVRQVNPIVRYGLNEGPKTSWRHAMTEVALISYLLGRGYDLQTAYRMVESWEIDETFPTMPSGR
ncbi:hypothetical protein [Haloplasma contractile]|uniref:Uncharacterized protein n=1 Tax=Haloplasma contractile SSD-17B TaxID=1033810 RepID=U2EFM2_9MOLU|nr:hypothetical protein [Haloplasma contractile]ERJ13451.1 hypothetical protein HLPCO_000102 [Haloplasma contractile SSD-17B]